MNGGATDVSARRCFEGCSLAETDDEETLWAKARRFAEDRLGVTSILFGFTHSRHLAGRVGMTQSLYIRHDHPTDYLRRFAPDRILDDDLCALILLGGTGVFLWDTLAGSDEHTEAQRERARIDREEGMGVGVSLGFRFADGHGIAGVGLAARWMPAEEFRGRWAENGAETVDFFTRFEALMRRRMVEARLVLTPRQRDVLSLSVGGLPGKSIAARLGISEGRVERLFREIRTRLEADTTIEAAAKALAYKLI